MNLGAECRLKGWMMVIPDLKTMNDFNELIAPVFEKIKNNAAQVQSLSKTRDTLLPKLMSGRIRVNGKKEIRGNVK